MSDIHPVPKRRGFGCLRAVLGVIALLVVVVLAFALLIRKASRVEPLPSDAQLIATFQTHRSDFERIRHLLAERSGDLRTDPGNPPPTPATPAEAELLQLLRKLDIRYGVENYSDDVVLMAGVEGKARSHFRKGYTYRTEAPKEDLVRRKRIAASLDEKSDPTTQWTSYRPIGDGWYLFMIGGD